MSPAELRQAVEDKRSVIMPGYNRDWNRGDLPGNERPLPAAVVVNMQWSCVDRRLPTMKLYERSMAVKERFRS